jgi:hypothetical protein
VLYSVGVQVPLSAPSIGFWSPCKIIDQMVPLLGPSRNDAKLALVGCDSPLPKQVEKLLLLLNKPRLLAGDTNVNRVNYSRSAHSCYDINSVDGLWLYRLNVPD